MASKVNINITAKDDASRAFQSVAKSASDTGNHLKNFGKAALLGFAGAAAGTFAFAKSAMSAAAESEKIGKQTAAIIKATGGAAKVSAADISKLSEALSLKTGVDDEVIQSGQNLMLTFKGIRNEVGEGNDIFNRASAAMLDMGNVFGSSDAAAMQLGKALDNPTKGITALARAGVSFTAQQKEQIKALQASGNILGAQKIILAEIEHQVGGTAAATATNADRMKVAWGNLQERIGGMLLPTFEKFAAVVLTTVLPAMTQFADKVPAAFERVRSTVTSAVESATAFFTSVAQIVQNSDALQIVLAAAVGALVAYKVGMVAVAAYTAIVTAATAGWAAVQAVLNGAMLANPIGAVVVAIVALGAAVAAAYFKFDSVRKAVDSTWQAIQRGVDVVLPAIQGAWTRWGDDLIRVGTTVTTWLRTNITAAFNAVKDVISVTVSAIKELWARWGGDIENIARDVFGRIKGLISAEIKAVQGVIKAITSLIRGDWDGAWNGMKQALSGILDAIKALIAGAFAGIKAAAKIAFEGIKEGGIIAWNAGVAWVKSIPGSIRNALGAVGSMLYDVGRQIIQGLINGIKSLGGAVGGAIGDVVGGGIKKAKSLLGIHSPSKVFHEIGENITEGMALGILSKEKAAYDATRRVAQGVTEAMSNEILRGEKAVLDKMRGSDQLGTAAATGDTIGKTLGQALGAAFKNGASVAGDVFDQIAADAKAAADAIVAAIDAAVSAAASPGGYSSPYDPGNGSNIQTHNYARDPLTGGTLYDEAGNPIYADDAAGIRREMTRRQMGGAPVSGMPFGSTGTPSGPSIDDRRAPGATVQVIFQGPVLTDSGFDERLSAAVEQGWRRAGKIASDGSVRLGR